MKQGRVTTSLVLVPPNLKGKNPHSAGDSKAKKIVFLVFAYLFLTAMALIIIFPFYYMIAASVMSEASVKAGKFFPDLLSVVENATFNYQNTIGKIQYLEHIGTTLIVAISTTTLQLITTILAAFAFAKMEFKGRDVLFVAFLATMMIPGELMGITNVITMSNLGLYGANQTYGQAILAMVLPLISSSFYIYLLRQNFKQMPEELYMAARVDGKSNWEYLWLVVVPMAKPTLITIALLAFIGSWNSYIWPSLIVNNPDNTVISVMIRSSVFELMDDHDQFVVQYSWQMAASVLVVVPLLILFIVFRKYIMSGTRRQGGIKG